MEIFILLGITFANAVALLLVYQFVKRLTKMDKIIFLAACFAISYVLVSITYWISGFGISDEVNEAAKTFITYVFVPVNIILLAPFVATKYSKWRANEIEKEKLIKRLIIITIIGIVILTCECFYFKNIKQNIMNIQEAQEREELKEQEKLNEQEQSNSEDAQYLTNIINTNKIDVNITNKEVINGTTTSISKNVVESTLDTNNVE